MVQLCTGFPAPLTSLATSLQENNRISLNIPLKVGSHPHLGSSLQLRRIRTGLGVCERLAGGGVALISGTVEVRVGPRGPPQGRQWPLEKSSLTQSVWSGTRLSGQGCARSLMYGGHGARWLLPERPPRGSAQKAEVRREDSCWLDFSFSRRICYLCPVMFQVAYKTHSMGTSILIDMGPLPGVKREKARCRDPRMT